MQCAQIYAQITIINFVSYIYHLCLPPSTEQPLPPPPQHPVALAAAAAAVSIDGLNSL